MVNSESRLRPISMVRSLLDRGGHQQLCSFTLLHYFRLRGCLPAAIVNVYRSNPKCAKYQAQLGKTIFAPCYFNFSSGTCVSSPTVGASKTSKTATVWWLAPNLKQIQLALKCQINNGKTKRFTIIAREGLQ